jgi:hypothetical protein
VFLGDTAVACDSGSSSQAGRGMGASVHPDIEHRSDLRSNVFLTAVLLNGEETRPVRVRNLSPGGAFLDGERIPPVGANVRLVRGSLAVTGNVAWQSEGHAGLRFDREIDVAAWVNRVGHPGQRKVDRAVDALRHSQPLATTADTPMLVRISAELDGICERISASRSMTVEVGEELVRLDALARALQQLACDARGFTRA